MTGFGIALWSAEAAGDPLIEAHDETTTGAGHPHEELYLVLEGRATFTVDGEEHDAPAGTCVLVDVGTMRSAVAAEAGTSVIALGGRPGAALPVSPFEHYYAAQPAHEAGDYDRAVAIASEGLADWPDHPLIHYQLACFHSRAGRLDEARRSLDIAFAGDERTRAWAAQDDDLAALRDQAPRAP
ncbi:MAG TPA: tetratricopeptide repeat protein [Solirubrobacteraceae bacterium]|nr:tetratricopeptide repeat protein [Solirubrobacteraceae bacterium]